MGFDFALMPALQNIAILLSKESMYTGICVDFVIIAALYTITYLIQIAMHLNKDLRVSAEVSKDRAKISASKGINKK